MEGEWVECIGFGLFVHGENSTRLRAPLLEDPGKEVVDSGVLVGFIIVDLETSSLLREEVDGGLGGRVSRIDMVTGNQDEMP